MSNHLMDRVWREAPFDGGRFTTLLALADAANDNGIFWHKVETLAVKTRLSERQCQRYLADFVRLAILERHARKGHSNVWRLVLPPDWKVLLGIDEENTPTPEDLLKAAEDVEALTGDTHDTPLDEIPVFGVTPMTPRGDTITSPTPDIHDTSGVTLLRHPGVTLDVTHNPLLTPYPEPSLEPCVEPRAYAREATPSPVKPVSLKRNEKRLLWIDVSAALNFPKYRKLNVLEPAHLVEIAPGKYELDTVSSAHFNQLSLYTDAIENEMGATLRARRLPFLSIEIKRPLTPAQRREVHA